MTTDSTTTGRQLGDRLRQLAEMAEAGGMPPMIGRPLTEFLDTWATQSRRFSDLATIAGCLDPYRKMTLSALAASIEERLDQFEVAARRIQLGHRRPANDLERAMMAWVHRAHGQRTLYEILKKLFQE